MWTPDVYQGAPTPVTAFMSVGTKAAAFAGFFRLMMTALPSYHDQWAMPLAILAVLTMTVGNLTALRQSSVKRMLAYSGIAHAGNILIALVAGTAAASSAAAFYLFAYAFMNIGAFTVTIAFERQHGNENDLEQSRLAGAAECAGVHLDTHRRRERVSVRLAQSRGWCRGCSGGGGPQPGEGSNLPRTRP